MWITGMGNHGVVGGISELRRSSCSSLAWSLIIGLSAGNQPAGDSVPETLVQILHSAEEDNLFPIDSKINKKHVYL